MAAHDYSLCPEAGLDLVLDSDLLIGQIHRSAARQFENAFRNLPEFLRFQYAGNVPVYATSDAYATDGGVANQDLEGLIIPAMPWIVPNSGAAAALRATLATEAGDSALWQSGLYAFGYDACQMAMAIAAAGGNTRLVHVAGLTGELTDNPDGRVHREPSWARISRGGEPQLLGSATSSGAGE